VLAEVSRKKPDSLQLVFLFPEREADEAKQWFFASTGMAGITIQSADFTRCGFGGTPTVVLLDARGRILGEWIGLLSPEQERQILEPLLKAATDRRG
jgi:hypothetical protein